VAEIEPRQPNTLGNTSLTLGILACIFVFSIGLCSGVAQQQGWLKHVGTLFFILGAIAAFIGALGALIGFGGLFGRNRSKATAIIGFIFCVVSVLLFAAIVNAVK
jgi:hypothetical protein